MSKLFGEIRQIAFVVHNIDEAMHYWAKTLGIGPFFIKRRLTFSNFSYRGSAAASPCVSIALANSGELQIELVQQHDERPSIYREFVDSGREGLQHVSAWVTRSEFDARRAELLRSGVELAQEGVIPASGVRLAYFSTEQGPGGFIYEIADLLEPGQYERVQGIEKAARAWDGVQVVHEVKV